MDRHTKVILRMAIYMGKNYGNQVKVTFMKENITKTKSMDMEHTDGRTV